MPCARQRLAVGWWDPALLPAAVYSSAKNRLTGSCIQAPIGRMHQTDPAPQQATSSATRDAAGGREQCAPEGIQEGAWPRQGRPHILLPLVNIFKVSTAVRLCSGSNYNNSRCSCLTARIFICFEFWPFSVEFKCSPCLLVPLLVLLVY